MVTLNLITTTNRVHTMTSNGSVKKTVEHFGGFPSGEKYLVESEVFEKRGWLEMKTSKGQNYYLVKNKMLLVPDKSLPKISPKDLEKLNGLDGEEKELMIDALGIFNGKLV